MLLFSSPNLDSRNVSPVTRLNGRCVISIHAGAALNVQRSLLQRKLPSGSLRPVQSKMPPTVRPFASPSPLRPFRPSSSLAVKESAAVRIPRAEAEESAHWVDVPGRKL